MTTNIAVFIPAKSNRIEYVFKLIFKDLLGFSELFFFENVENFLESNIKIKISYGTFFNDRIAFLPKETTLLTEIGVGNERPEVLQTAAYPYAYPSSDKKAMLPFDFPAFAFYLLSRYEEYQSFKEDKHGRFSAKESLAYQSGFLQLPLVDLWARELSLRLSVFYSPEKLPLLPVFSFQPTYDIDHARAYLHKGFGRTLGAIVKNAVKLKFSELTRQLQTLCGIKPDPYDVFDYLDALHRQYPHLKPIYFYLLGNYGRFDKNTSHRVAAFRKLIVDTATKYEVGIHPSYRSNTDSAFVLEEIDRLENIIHKPVRQSRQHFLKLQFPQTYQNLLKLNIQQDYTMGYADTIGFRASIARSFYWYDLASECETTLRIHPFMFMDVTLKNYIKLRPDSVLEVIQPIVESCRSVGGELICIWHNNSFSEQEGWQGWRKVYEMVLEII